MTCPLCKQEVDRRMKRFIHSLVFCALFLIGALITAQAMIYVGERIIDYQIKNHPSKYARCK